MHIALITYAYFFTGAVVYGCLYLLHKQKNLEPSAREEGMFAEYLPVNATRKERLENIFVKFTAVFICLLIWPFVTAYILWHAWCTGPAPVNKHKSN